MNFKYFLQFFIFFCLSIGHGVSAQVQVDSLRIGDSTSMRINEISTADSLEKSTLAPFEIFLRPHLLSPYRLIELKNNQIILHNINSYAVSSYFSYNPQEKVQSGILKKSREKWVLFTSLFLFLGFALVKLFFSSDVKLIVEAYFNERIIVQVSKEDTILTSWPFIFLYLLFSLALSLFICIFYAYILDRHEILTFVNYLKVSVIIAVIFALKIGFIRFLAFVFEIQRLVKEYVTILYLIYFNSLLFLLPIVLVVSLTPAKYLSYIFTFSIFVGIVLFFYRFLRTALNVVTQQQFSIFYLILYLCCLEIAPILILVRLLS